MTVLGELLAIKALRESRAERSIARAAATLAEAKHGLQAAQSALERFRREAQAQEAAWYRDLCSQVVRLRAIHDVQEGMAQLRAGERDHEGRAEGRRKSLQQAQDRMTQAREALRQACRAKRKLVELGRALDEEAALETQRKEDLEMEEAASVRQHAPDAWKVCGDA